MPMRCTICRHPKVQAIDAALAEGSVSERVIASRYGLTKGSVHRHKLSHLPARIERAVEQRRAAEDNGFLERVEYLWGECRGAIQEAKRAVRTTVDRDGNEVVVGRDLAPLAPLLGQAHRNAELYGKGTGALAGDQQDSRVQVVMLMPGAQVSIGPADEQDGPATIDITPQR